LADGLACPVAVDQNSGRLRGRVGQRLDAAVIEIGAAIEDDFRDAGAWRALGDQLADRGAASVSAPVLPP
jgi:hypothetical protein